MQNDQFQTLNKSKKEISKNQTINQSIAQINNSSSEQIHKNIQPVNNNENEKLENNRDVDYEYHRQILLNFEKIVGIKPLADDIQIDKQNSETNEFIDDKTLLQDMNLLQQLKSVQSILKDNIKSIQSDFKSLQEFSDVKIDQIDLKKQEFDADDKQFQTGCYECISQGNKYCFLKMKQRQLAILEDNKNKYISTGNGKCCDINDDKTASCNSNLILPYQVDPIYKDYDIQLVCSMSYASYKSESPDVSQQLKYKSLPYEFCPHFNQQCNLNSTFQLETEAQNQIQLNEPLKININKMHNFSWKQLKINSLGTVCSYKFEGTENPSMVYQIRIEDHSNLQLGLYFQSNLWSQIIDYQIFDPIFCHSVRNCKLIINKTSPISLLQTSPMVFTLEDSKFTNFNFLPKDPSIPMTATLQIRQINKNIVEKNQNYQEAIYLLILLILSAIVIFLILKLKKLFYQNNDELEDDNINLSYLNHSNINVADDKQQKKSWQSQNISQNIENQYNFLQNISGDSEEFINNQSIDNIFQEIDQNHSNQAINLNQYSFAPNDKQNVISKNSFSFRNSLKSMKIQENHQNNELKSSIQGGGIFDFLNDDDSKQNLIQKL